MESKRYVEVANLQNVNLFKGIHAEFQDGIQMGEQIPDHQRSGERGIAFDVHIQALYQILIQQIIRIGRLRFTDLENDEIVIGEIGHPSFAVLPDKTTVDVGVTQKSTRDQVNFTLLHRGIQLPKDTMVGELSSYKGNTRSATLVTKRATQVIEGAFPFHDIFSRMENDAMAKQRITARLNLINRSTDSDITPNDVIEMAALGYLRSILQGADYLSNSNQKLAGQNGDPIKIKQTLPEWSRSERTESIDLKPGEKIDIPEGHFLLVINGQVDVIDPRFNATLGNVERGVIGERIAVGGKSPYEFVANRASKVKLISVKTRRGKTRSREQQCRILSYLVRQWQDKLQRVNKATQALKKDEKVITIDIARRRDQLKELTAPLNTIELEEDAPTVEMPEQASLWRQIKAALGAA